MCFLKYNNFARTKSFGSCFNPYSGGCAFWSNISTASIVNWSLFQSLFWWMCFLKQKIIYPPMLKIWVSILILVDVLSEVGFPHVFRTSFSVFQSLFWWMCFLKKNPIGCNIVSFNVSILILVDVLSEVDCFYIFFTSNFSFNPYSGGCAFWRILL